MKIDRHNYEEYFLLYIDNELNVEQKKQVELFVKENADLEEELVMLQQLKLIPDKTIVFDKKDLLMKEENNSLINMNNYEEWLILYVDNELNEKETVVVEKFAAAHPHIQQELNLFQQTKLQSEKIVFADKEVLYRRERVTVISMQWWRVAVAAILIMAAGVTAYSIFKNSNNGKRHIEIVKTRTNIDPISNKTSNSLKLTISDKKEQNIIKQNKQVANTISVNKKLTKEKQSRKAIQQNNQLLVNNPGNIGTEKAQPITSSITEKTIQPQLSNTVVIGDKTHKENFNPDSVTKHQRETPQPIYASNNTENKRLRGFFRKATRLIERTTNINPANDDNKVLIGGMAFNLK